MARLLIAKGYTKVYALKGGWREWDRAEFPTEEKESERPSVVQACIDCHSSVTPGIVAEWRQSKHSRNMVSCLMCHGVDHTSEKDVARAKAVKPDLCAMCHDEEGRQFAAGKHALAWEAMKALPAAHWKTAAMIQGETPCRSCHRIGFKTEEEILELRREGAGPGLASCDTCHARHSFSVEEARNPEACRACHHGPDQPLWEVYAGSRHGIRYSLKGAGSPPGGNRAPTCQTCHMEGKNHEVRTAGGFLGIHHLPGPDGGSPDQTRQTILQALGLLDPDGKPTDRLPLVKDLDLARPTREEWDRERARMSETCRRCHPARFVESNLEQADTLLVRADLLLAEAIRILAGLYQDGLLATPWTYAYPFPDLLAAHDDPQPIERTLRRMFFQDRMEVLGGAFHANLDHAFYRGLDAMEEDLARIRTLEAEIRGSARLILPQSP